MAITTSDIKRALVNGGDVSSLVPALNRALGIPPVAAIASLGLPVVLPEPFVLLKDIDSDLMPLVETWPAAGGDGRSPLPDVEVVLVGLPPYGRNTGRYLESVIDEVAPDYVAIYTSPVDFSANMLYAFSMPCAVGLPVNGEISTREEGHFYADMTFYPGNLVQTAIIRCWRDRLPLIPVGMPSKKRRRTSGENQDIFALDKEIQQAHLTELYRVFDARLESTPDQPKGKAVMQEIGTEMSRATGDHISQSQIDEAGYLASRIVEAASYIHSPGRKTKLLAIVDIKYYLDTGYFIDLLNQGIKEEIYLPPEYGIPAGKLAIVGRYSAEIGERAKHFAPDTTPVKERLSQELEKFTSAKAGEKLTESEVNGLIAAIAGRTREHQDVARGASPRGAIAFKEVLHGFQEMRGGPTRGNIEKAARVTLPSRISPIKKDHQSAVAIVDDILKEILYGIQFSRVRIGDLLSGKNGQLSPEDIINALKNLDRTKLTPEQLKELSRKGRTVVAADDLEEQLGNLTSDDLTQEDINNFIASTRRTIEQMLAQLERKLRQGEITEDQFQQEKARLEEILNAAEQLQNPMSGRELAETVMEFMDAKDKQWGKEISPERMYVYYHIKGTCEGKPLSSPKQSYHKMRAVFDGLKSQGVLKGSPVEQFQLSAGAMDILLEQVTVKARKGRELKSVMNNAKAPVSERIHEIRRYTVGDVFRDISVRHTLKEIARQRKNLCDVDRRDFRVFMKQHHRLQSDLVLCVDSSGSMGFHQKLIYARLAAAKLANVAIEEGGRVGIVTFDDYGKAVLPLTDRKEDIFDYLAGINAGGNTNIGDGIDCATQLLLRESSSNQKYIVLVTDGLPSAISQKAFDQLRTKTGEEDDLSEDFAIMEARNALAKGVKTSVIHITDSEGTGRDFVENVARTGSGQVRTISAIDDLEVVLR